MARVLVADDDIDILELVEIILKSAGHEVKRTDDVTNFYKLITSFCPDILLLDVFMPPFDNRTLCKALKDTPGFTTPILLFSANDMDDRSLNDCGADGFLPKPFEISQLRWFVDRGLFAGKQSR